jgi:hypothetical protein
MLAEKNVIMPWNLLQESVKAVKPQIGSIQEEREDPGNSDNSDLATRDQEKKHPEIYIG